MQKRNAWEVDGKVGKQLPVGMTQATSPKPGRTSRTKTLTDYLDQRLDPLVDQSIEIAKTNGFAPFTTTIRSAWVEAILSVTASLHSYLSADTGPAKGPLATLDYAEDSRFKRMRQIARMHRSLGITLQMYVGLFKHFRNLYLAELDAIPGGLQPGEADRVRDFFDESELSISADWHGSSDNQRLRELQARTRAITLDKDRYIAVFESLQTPAFLLDRQDNLVDANQAAADLFLESDKQAGDTLYLRLMQHGKAELKQLISKVLQSVAQDDHAIWLETLTGLRYFVVRIRSFQDAVDNTPIGQVILLNDVTRLQRRAEEAQQSEKGMSRFLATMSHEIKTPLHSVLGAAELLRTADRANFETYLDIIEDAGSGLLQTLSNVLDYSKFRDAAPMARPVATNLREELRTFERVANLGRSEAKSRLAFSVKDNVPQVTCVDWAMIQQILKNLVANALRADLGGGVCLSVSGTAAEKGSDTTMLRFDVQDHGPGISPSAADALFQPFDRTIPRDTGRGGSGLGLPICSRLVDAMSGQIGYSNSGTGAHVWFQVPVHEPARATRAVPHLREDWTIEPGKAGVCLLVDDDPIGSIVTMHQLEELGFAVTYAASAKDARNAAIQSTFDVIILDYRLPDGDGVALAKDLKRMGSEGTRYLALTANSDALIDQAHVFDEVLSKPLGKVGLATALFGVGGRAPEARAKQPDTMDSLQGLCPSTVVAMMDAFETAWSDFRSALRRSDVMAKDQSIQLAAHRLAGSCAFLGLSALEQKLRALDRAAPDDTAAKTRALAASLDIDLEALDAWQRLNDRWRAS